MLIKISPSVMCVDFFELDKYIKCFEQYNIELLHIDIMDGNFVPNYTLGTDFIRTIKQKTNIPLDIHLMIENPEKKLDWFEFGENDYVSVHYESTPHIHKALTIIKNKGAKAVVALNPGTPIGVIENLLDDIDAILIMTVNPGFTAQKFIPEVLPKIEKVAKMLPEGTYLEVDGGIGTANAKDVIKAGANVLVAGASVFYAENPAKAIEELHNTKI